MGTIFASVFLEIQVSVVIGLDHFVGYLPDNQKVKTELDITNQIP